MKYRWRNGKAQAITYVPALGRCAVVAEANSIHELYSDSKNENENENDEDDEDDQDEDD